MRNRLVKLTSNNEPDSSSGSSQWGDAFTPVPACFWQGLSPEQFTAQQQIYQIAHEEARRRANSAPPEGGELSFDI